ncbi:hypothetical protein BI312_23685 (plasmid) [Xanthomonas citri pv. citri]|nr:hypothetical protein BI315_23595 [Xanthomonas citri pv. citri]APR22616.1 hypothetical protein BI316_23855 [Xanthomonas citri pv. citri]APR27253.1 hypothetical protein BJD09_23720 [Xanthomonas citri pv. citri]AUZ53536.1 hypothetical protein CLM98_23575 [Xanthomonas citri pv. citri]OLR69526.1 hypothetical protein BI312_23685 [Xanthomonas citri pv. citri]
MEGTMQYLTVREVFHRWLNKYNHDAQSVSHAARRKAFSALVDPTLGSHLCGTLKQEDARRTLREGAALRSLDSAAAAFHMLNQAMAWADLWPAEAVVYEPFIAGTSLEIPLSSYQVAALVTKLPVNYRVACHIILLTGIKPATLTSITMGAFMSAFEASIDTDSPDLIHPVYVANSPQPVFLTNPVLTAMNKHVSRCKDAERVFQMAPTSIASTWNRYAGDAPVLSRFKGTAATHLLKLGADAHALSANLGVSLASAGALMERLRPASQSVQQEALA